MPIPSYPHVPDPRFDPVTALVTSVNRPLIPIRLGFNGRVTPDVTDCLLDSGADSDLFPGWWGDEVGIPVAEGSVVELGGIGGHTIRAYRHRVTLVAGQREILANVDFCYRHDFPLLGRSGFFDHFAEVRFSESERMVRLEYQD